VVATPVGGSPPEALADHCEAAIGPPRIVEVVAGVRVAVGHDLANVAVVETGAGPVLIDAGSDPVRAQAMREALLGPDAPPVAALVYTHGHIDHVGGAAAWIGPDSQIWATDALPEEVARAYGVLREAEARRGARQFGRGVPDTTLPCSAIGPRPDLEAVVATGLRLPTHTFSGERVLEIGDVTLHLMAAPGETGDQLFVWLPDQGVLFAGDNVYRAFPNLYTLRGSRPRPVDEWIASIDRMRALSPRHLVPGHTAPVSGGAEVAAFLTDYRDAIQWVRDEVVRGLLRGEDLDAMAHRIALPPHLANAPHLQELYGQVDWSVRAIHGARVGWFDERPERLYALPDSEVARREVALMGGADALMAAAEAALAEGEAAWAVHLLAKLRRSGEVPSAGGPALESVFADALEVLGGTVANSNGRGWLLAEVAGLRSGGDEAALPRPPLDDALLRAIPLDAFFEGMAVRLDPGRAGDAHESVAFQFPDEGRRFVVTVRRGVAEVVAGDPLPGTPDPVATVVASGIAWRRLALGQEGALSALGRGDLQIEGSRAAFLRFIRMFDR
jgi:alkyl sulfatase BDS1-like metallo-beta-lactamase superfamily hydrolase